jgi:hypothetical protein
MPTNQILQFCPTDTGTNLLSQSDYLAAGDRTNGNQPGVASSKLNNKALRQASYVASQMAQMISNQLAADVLDDDVPAKLLAQFLATLKPYAPNPTKYTANNTWNMNYVFFIATGSATAAATYTNNAVTFTVVSTVASGTEIRMTGAGDPTANGTLTKASGTGDATLTFYAMRKPLYIEVEGVGGGGGGSGSGAGSGNGGAGGTSTFGTSLLSAPGGSGGQANDGGAGGTGVSLGTGPIGFAVNGADGNPAGSTASSGSGGNGGTSALGGSGRGHSGNAAAAGTNAQANSGSGGGGAALNAASGAGGGGAGCYIKAKIFSPLSTYGVVVGAAGAAGAGANAGGTGGAGQWLVTEHYQ